jgi:probable H4MPT-linked C1 transfer pathway protein
MTRDVIGLDVGGANLKAAHSGGACLLRPFALWREPSALPRVLAECLPLLPTGDRLAVTMSGELCDCFASKREGVYRILDAAAEAAGDTPVRVWLTDGRLVDLRTAYADSPLLAAAANWLALATWAGRLAPEGPALLIDIGSTTTDIIPLVNGVPTPTGRTDPQRLRSGELVYTGVRRTPVCALGGPGVGPLAAELFATTHDVYLALGLVPEAPADSDTADGRPATVEFAHARLARMLGADAETSSAGERLHLAEAVHRHLVELIAEALRMVAGRLPGPPRAVILSGSGEFLAERVLERQRVFPPCRVVSLRKEMGESLSAAACAYAVAVLGAET